MTLRTSRLLAASLLFTLSTTSALASSPDAWEEFEADVRLKCLELLTEAQELKEIQVDPFGSEQFGLAVLRVEDRATKTPQTAICVYGKQSQQAEMGSLF